MYFPSRLDPRLVFRQWKRLFFLVGKPALIACLGSILFLTLSGAALAADVTYTGNGATLLNDPQGVQPGPAYVYPTEGGTPVPSGNTVTIFYVPNASGMTDPTWVYGGFSDTGDSTDNIVNMVNGNVYDTISGGYAFGGTASIGGGYLRRMERR